MPRINPTLARSKLVKFGVVLPLAIACWSYVVIGAAYVVVLWLE